MTTPATILVADDDAGIRTVLDQALGRQGYDVRSTGHAATLWRWVANGDGDLVVADVVMPDGDGLDLLPRIKNIRPELPIIVMSARNTLITAIKATERGAYEYLPKPFDLTELANVVQRALSVPAEGLGQEAAAEGVDEPMPLVGRSPAMQEVYRILARLMPTDLTVLITGESGTGKDLAARALHDYGKRRNGPFVAVNMAAIPRELVESELFGHEKGAFTGASLRRIGRFAQAEGGTLFLDEIGDMPIEAQTRLLRVLQQGEYVSVGGQSPVKTDVRIIAASNRDLSQMIRQGLFREDLYYRLAVVPVRMPPLRERPSDIPDLVRHFLNRALQEGLPAKTVDKNAMALLQEYSWPGNVRELENLIRRLTALYTEDVIGPAVIGLELAQVQTAQEGDEDRSKDDSLADAVERHLGRYFDAHADGLPPGGLYHRVLHEIERPLITLALGATRGNQVRTAELLGLNRNTLRKKIRELGIGIVRGMR